MAEFKRGESGDVTREQIAEALDDIIADAAQLDSSTDSAKDQAALNAKRDAFLVLLAQAGGARRPCPIHQQAETELEHAQRWAEEAEAKASRSSAVVEAARRVLNDWDHRREGLRWPGLREALRALDGG